MAKKSKNLTDKQQKIVDDAIPKFLQLVEELDKRRLGQQMHPPIRRKPNGELEIIGENLERTSDGHKTTISKFEQYWKN